MNNYENVIHIADQTFIAADPSTVRACLDQLNWDSLWPDLQCIITQDRDNLGIRWKITGPIHGTMELWFQPHLNGVMLHFFLHGSSVNPQFSTHRKLDYDMPEKAYRALISWYAKKFRFKWDQHGVRRNARKIAYSIKINAEKPHYPDENVFLQ